MISIKDETIEQQLIEAKQRIAKLQQENNRLKAIIKEYNSTEFKRNKEEEFYECSETDKVKDAASCIGIKHQKVNSLSSPKEKVQLFKSLFRGREDVFAVRWTAKNGKSGYSPACLNDWKAGKCGKYRKISCVSCEYRKLIPLDSNQYYRHLQGDVVIGIYPLLQDDSCFLLAFDFDNREWRNDVKACYETCILYDIPAYIEISRSGDGAHLWIFFDAPVPAKMARKLGTILLTITMERRYQIGLNSYDRIFPNQDTMPKGGFGNLIALPMQKEVRKAGNSLFLDRDLRIIEDQWAFLAEIERISYSKIAALSSELMKEERADGKLRESIGEDCFDQGSAEAEILPWEKSPETDNEFGILPNQVKVVTSNMLYIEKEGLSSKLLNRIIRLSAFRNPEYYRAQAMRLPIYNKPRIINLASDFEKHIAVPRGCFDELLSLFSKAGVKVIIEDKTHHGKRQNFEFKGTLREEQLAAAKELLKHDNGVLSATTAFGKTIVALWLIAARRTSTLIVVHRKQLLQQWKERVACFTNLESEEIGEIGAGKDNRKNKIDIALIQSLFRDGKVKDFVRDYGMVIVDECHHISAFSFEQVLREAKAKYVYGLTATPVRKDGHHPIVFMQCGDIRYRVDYRRKNSKQSFHQKVIVKQTGFRMPEELKQTEVYINQLYQALIKDDNRNDLIINDIISAVVQGKSPLILTERKAHVDFFFEKLSGFAKHIIVLKGGMGKKQFQDVMKRLKSISENEERIIIGTGKYIGEGFDDSRLDTLFLTLPISWKGLLQQYAGRLHRTNKAKTEVVIYDYVDMEVAVLAAMYQKRLKGYRNMGYQVSDMI
jgi:superfamily II DNA or RNA helicase